MSFDLTQKIKVVNPTSNIDELYGPYTSVANALAGVPVVLRQLGRTVGIIEGGTIKEYWFKNGITDSDLVEKSGGEGGGESIGNKEYKISLSDLDVTGWEDPTFDDKLAEYIQTLNITVDNNEVPYFVIEKGINFRLQADWGPTGVTEENFPQIASMLLSQADTNNSETPANISSITNFKIENNILSCTIEGDYNSFRMLPIPGNSVDLNELACDVEILIIGTSPEDLFPITAFKPEYPFKKLKFLMLMGQITEWVDTDWISHVPNNGTAILIGIESAAGSPVESALLAKGWTVEFEFVK